MNLSGSMHMQGRQNPSCGLTRVVAAVSPHAAGALWGYMNVVRTGFK